MKHEEWKDIPGYEGLYQVSNLGRVKSLSRKFSPIERLLTLGGRNYKHCVLSKQNKVKTYLVHRLVAKAFVLGVGEQVNHKDGNKHNNNWGNLEWVTAKENTKHATQLGNRPDNRFENNGLSKLTKDLVKRIREQYINKEKTQQQLALEYNLHQTTIHNVVANKTWRLL